MVASALDACGIDPITYNYRPFELIKETIEDFKQLKSSIMREWKIFKQTKGDVLSSTKLRREMLTEQGWALKLYDAVKIIDLEHQYCGRTGVVVRIDTSIPGQPLYEIKLDHSGVTTFVMMTTDALQVYSNPQPLIRITKVPVLGNYLKTRMQPIYGLKKDDPFFDGKRVDAAWCIQVKKNKKMNFNNDFFFNNSSIN
jgi:hypothetical protein